MLRQVKVLLFVLALTVLASCGKDAPQPDDSVTSSQDGEAAAPSPDEELGLADDGISKQRLGFIHAAGNLGKSKEIPDDPKRYHLIEFCQEARTNIKNLIAAASTKEAAEKVENKAITVYNLCTPEVKNDEGFKKLKKDATEKVKALGGVAGREDPKDGKPGKKPRKPKPVHCAGDQVLDSATNTCQCKTGLVLEGDGDCVCAQGFKKQGGVCGTKVQCIKKGEHVMGEKVKGKFVCCGAGERLFPDKECRLKSKKLDDKGSNPSPAQIDPATVCKCPAA